MISLRMNAIIDTVNIDVKIEPSWKAVLGDEFRKDYFQELREFLTQERNNGVTIYPAGSRIFAAFDLTPFDKVKAVILGQDPYHVLMFC